MNIVASLLLSALTYAVSDGCDTVLTEAGACCVFPFEYNGEKYCDCTSNNWFRPWCSLTPFYAGKWGHCPDDQGTTAAPTSSGCNTVQTKEGDCCHFPFEYKGETYCKCTSNNWVRPWCSLTPIYEGMWGHCPDHQPTTAPPVGTTTAPPTTSDNQPTTTPPVGTTTAPPTTSDNQPTTATPWVTTAAPPPPTTSEAVPCGSRPPGTRIVGGTQAQNGSWPWMAMLAFAGGSQFCGGSLILEEWVLTAASCVDGFSPSQIVVRMGAYKITDIAQELQVDRIIMHEEYDNNTFMNDIALLKLKTKATLSAGVGLVCPLGLVARENTLEGETGYITGWGSMSQGGTQPNYLQEAALQVISNSECQIAYNRKSVPITRSMMCTEPDEGAWRGACHGDSGGPLVWEFNGKWHIAGISSWGRPACSDVNFPDVYTRVGEYAFWIKSSTKARYI